MLLSRSIFSRTATLALFAAGFVALFREWLSSGFDAVFAEDGDSRILISILAHWHWVFTGRANWTDPSFFYPVGGALGLTDAVFLYGIVHAGLRALGIDAFTAFMVLMAALSAVGFFGFLRLAHRHFDIAMPWAAVGAFVFAFANMNFVTLVHAQTYCVMLLPALCDLALTAWKESRQRRQVVLAGAAGFLHALIFLTAFQTAWFFTVFLILFALLHPAVFGLRRALALLSEFFDSRRPAILAYAGAFALGILPFLLLYLPVLLGGRQRDLAEVFSNSPEPRDILNVTVGNWLWGEPLRQLGITGQSKVWWEVEYGYTPAVLALALATVILLGRNLRAEISSSDRDRWLVLLGTAVIVVWLLQLDYFGFRPWSVVWAAVPGAGAIRYTFRSQLVANLFVSLLIARGLAGCYALARERRAAIAAVAGLTFVIIVEQANVLWPGTASRREMMAWIDAVPPPPAGCSVSYLAPGKAANDHAGWMRQADAMLLSQLRGIPTINGYSTWLPEHWDLEEPASHPYPANVRDWASRKGVSGLCAIDLARGAWTVGLPK